MIETSERRRVARITIPWQHLTKPSLELRWVRLLELSSGGARIEHPEPVHEGVVCFVDLPPALGQAGLTGRVVWTRPHKSEQTLEGDTPVYYQSGLAFVGITPEQRTALTAALEILRTARDMPEGDSSR
jgi:hypothetical protein